MYSELSTTCGAHAVSLGDTEESVLDGCGQPVSATRQERSCRRSHVTVDRWMYGGAGDLPRVLEFENYVLRRIEVGVSKL